MHMKKAKLLLDENIGVLTITALRKEGYAILSILEDFPSASDEEVLDMAQRQGRVLVTLDKDFGRLIFQYSQKHVGVIFLRLKKESAENINKVLIKILDEYSDKLEGKFLTVSEKNVRIK